MATLAFGIAGAGLGAMTGVGAGAGWLVGTTLGRLLFPEEGGGHAAPLSDLNVTGARYGAMIPRLYGTMRLGGNIVWASGLRAEAVTSGGGKGGAGAPETTGYAYYASFAVAICEGEVSRLLKIWADGQVIYDAGAAGAVIAPGVRFRFYAGDEAQLPDSIMEAAEGAGNVPGYRGLCYLLFDNLPLHNYGNRLPNIEVMVTTEPVAARPVQSADLAGIAASSFAYDAARGLLYSYEVTGGVDRVRKIDAATLEEQAVAVIETEFPRLPDASVGFSRDRDGAFWIGTGAALLAGRKIHRVDGETLQIVASSDLPSGVGAIGPSTDIRLPLDGAGFQVAGSQQNYQVVVFDAALAVIATIETTARVCTGAVTDQDEVAWLAMSGRATGPVFSDLDIVRVSLSPEMSPAGTSYRVSSEIFTIPSADLTPLGGGGGEVNNITYLVAYLPATNELLFQNAYRLFKWSTRHRAVTATRDVSDLSGSLSLVDGNNGMELVFVSAGRYAVYLSAETLAETERVDLYEFDGVSASVSGVYDAGSDSLFAFNGEFGLKRLYLRRGSGEGALISDIVSDLAQLGRLEAGDIDVSKLSGRVPGYLVGRPMTIAEALTPLSHYAFFDAVESGDVLRFLPRNQPPSGISISDGDMLAPPELRRLQESELPERVSISYLAADAGYQIGTQMEKRSFKPVATMFGRSQIARELPMALTADQARRVALNSLYAAWAERQALSAALPIRFLALDPADVITVELGGTAGSVRLMQSRLGADLTLEAEAVSLEPFSYEAALPGDGGSGYQQVLIRRPETAAELFLLDLPLLRDQDATAGNGSRFYFAIASRRGETGGALYSAFDEERYEIEGSVGAPAVWGVTLNALAPTDRPFQTDRSGYIDLRMISGEEALESVSDLALLSGANAILVGREIVQFGAVGGNPDGSYRLSRLLRGRRGTEGAVTDHKVGERAILLRADCLSGGFTALASIDMPRRWKAVLPGQLIEAAAPVTAALSGNDLRPYAPVHIRAVRAGGDLTLSWQRRSRLGAGSLSTSPPLGESAERYELCFEYDGRLVSKFVREEREFLYSAAEFNADFGAAEAEVPPLTLTLYQLSETIGRGFAATEIV